MSLSGEEAIVQMQKSKEKTTQSKEVCVVETRKGERESKWSMRGGRPDERIIVESEMQRETESEEPREKETMQDATRMKMRRKMSKVELLMQRPPSSRLGLDLLGDHAVRHVGYGLEPVDESGAE